MMAMDIRATVARALVDAAESYGVVGLRVTDTAPQLGDTLPRSGVWADDEPTGERLSGTSTVGVSSAAEIDAALTRATSSYLGRYIVVVEGGDAGAGQDAGELVIADALVVGVFDA
jgi:hypothetical protein